MPISKGPWTWGRHEVLTDGDGNALSIQCYEPDSPHVAAAQAAIAKVPEMVGLLREAWNCRLAGTEMHDDWGLQLGALLKDIDG